MKRALGIGLLVVGLLASLHIARAFWPTTDRRATTTRQLAYLQRSIADGHARDMQALFPEGELFTLVLTGLAAGNLARSTPDVAERRRWLDVEQAALEMVDEPRVAATFGTVPALEHGIFYRGWRLLLIADLATIDDATPRGTDHRPRAAAEADAIVRAVVASQSGFVDSYPGRAWPCDTVVALAAAHRAGADVSAWPARVAAARDPATGLLGHRVTADGRLAEGPRGSSQAIIQAFWPDIDPSSAAEQWSRFRSAFVTREAGLIGVREYPNGSSGVSDVDSGPLVLGVSTSASAVTLAAARTHGDTALAWALDSEADLLGAPIDTPSTRRYAFGQLPVGDAFVAWARSTPLADSPAPPHPSSAPLWGAWLAATLLVAASGPIVLRPGRQHRGANSRRPRHTSRAGRLRPAAAPVRETAVGVSDPARPPTSAG